MTRDRQEPPLKGQVLIYPITDCDFERLSYHEYVVGYFVTHDQMIWFWDQNVPDLALRQQSHASPYHARNLRKLSNSMIITAE